MPSSVFHRIAIEGRLTARRVMGASLFERLRFLIAHGRWPRLMGATTFNEKILARKLDASDSRYALVSDKVAVREWISQRIGDKHLVPIRAIYNYEDIDRLDSTPGQVVKCANRSGGVYFTTGQSGEEHSQLVKLLKSNLDFDFAKWSGEPWYDDIPKRVISEESLIGQDGIPPNDYKFFVFHGIVRTIQVDIDRFSNHRRAMFDRDWNSQPCIYGYEPPKVPPGRPSSLDRMIEIAEVLGREFDFVRVDLYEIDDHKIYFGEMTLAPASGLKRFIPVEFDNTLGSYW